MNLSKSTLTIIKNFANINGSIMLKEGNKLATISEGKNVMAEAVVEDTFPMDFGIYDLNEFLNVVSLFPNTDLEFTEKFVLVSDGGVNKIKYFAAGEGIVKAAPSNIRFPSPEIEFALGADQLAMIIKTASVLKASDVSFVGADGKLSVLVTDKKNDTANAYTVEIGECEQTFNCNLKVDNLKFLTGDYAVAISSKKITRFKNTQTDLTYYVAAEADSSF